MVTVYTLPNCPQCDTTKRFLTRNGIEYSEIDLSANKEALERIKEMGYTAAPVVDVKGGKNWSGFRAENLKTLIM